MDSIGEFIGKLVYIGQEIKFYRHPAKLGRYMFTIEDEERIMFCIIDHDKLSDLYKTLKKEFEGDFDGWKGYS